MTNIFNQDTFTNLVNNITGLGTGIDSINSTDVAYSSLYWNRQTYDKYYKRLWQARKICDYLPSMMQKSWCKIALGDGNQKIIASANKELDKLKKTYYRGQILANLYGGAVALRLANDDAPLNEPIDINNLKSIKYSQVFDRWSVLPDPISIQSNPHDPEYYNFYSSFGTGDAEFDKKSKLYSYKLHKSRILRFRGAYLSPYEMMYNQGWEDSVLTPFLDPLLRYLSAIGYAGEGVRTFEIIAHSIDNLFAKTSTADGEAQIKKRLKLNQQTLSALRFFALDRQSEEVNIISRRFQGVGDIIDRLKDEMIGASGLTKPQFYQEHPSGLAATGESERLAEANSIIALCEDKWSEQIYEDVELYFCSHDSITKGVLPDDYTIQWNSLFTQSPQEKANIKYQVAQTDNLNISNNIYTNVEARNSHYGGSEFDDNVVLDSDTTINDEIHKRAVSLTDVPKDRIDALSTDELINLLKTTRKSIKILGVSPSTSDKIE